VLPVQSLAATVLAEVIRRQPVSPARTTFAWSVAVGPALAKVTTVELAGGVLRVTPKDARWAREIERARDTILPRVQQLLGRDAVKDIAIHA
jgi:predicted nucleic acid-binding Zn ribbon protein